LVQDEVGGVLRATGDAMLAFAPDPSLAQTNGGSFRMIARGSLPQTAARSGWQHPRPRRGGEARN